jgi:hypothetical protein
VSAGALQIPYVGRDHCVALYANLCVVIAATDPQPGTSKVLHDACDKLAAKPFTKRGFLVVLRADAPPPSEKARTVIKEAMQVFDRTMQVGAFVVEREGFVGAAMRSALNMAMLAARPAFTMKVFENTEKASVWLAARVDEGLVAQDLCAAVARLSAAYAAGELTATT